MLSRWRTYAHLGATLAVLVGTTSAHAAPPPAKPLDGRRTVVRGTASCPQSLIPVYSGVSQAMWNRAVGDAGGGTVITNLGDGPGTRRSAHVAREIARAQRAGKRVIGYVDTRFAARSQTSAERDIRRWKSWYAVNGIFLDNVAGQDPNYRYYRRISARIRRTPGRLVVMNGAQHRRGSEPTLRSASPRSCTASPAPPTCDRFCE
jgi:hypothetical protein